MARPRRIFKNAAFAALAFASAEPVHAATFEAGRGINLDQWVTWPDESRWDDAEIMLPFPEWRKSIGKEGLKRLKDAGFDFVRIPADPSVLLSDKSAALRVRLIASLADSVRLVNAAGLKSIVDLHLIPAGSNRAIGMSQVMKDPAMFDRYLDAVRGVARAMSAFDPAMVAIEPMNEPVTGCEGGEQKAWEDRMLRLFAAARSSATRLTVVLSGSCWGGAQGLAAIDPAIVPDDNIIWSFHSYAPYLITSQGATWIDDMISQVWGLPYPLDAVAKSELDATVAEIRERIGANSSYGKVAYFDKLLAEIDTPEKMRAQIAKPFETVAAWAQRHGVERGDILLGEFGVIRQEYGKDHIVPAAYRAAFYRDVIGLAEDYGFGWSLWSYGGAFGVVEEFANKPAEPDVIEMIRTLPPRAAGKP